MAGDQEKVALQAHIAALETRVREIEGNAAQKARHYVIRTQVFEDCIPGTESGEPAPTTESGGESVQARLARIEAQLQRVVAKLES